MQTYLDLFSNDDLSEEILGALGGGVEDGEAQLTSSITDEELARLDALVNEPVRGAAAARGAGTGHSAFSITAAPRCAVVRCTCWQDWRGCDGECGRHVCLSSSLC